MAVNELDRLQQGKAPVVTNEYEAMLDGDREAKTAALKGSMFVAQQKDPARQAQVLDLAQKASLPASVVEKNFDEVKKRTSRPSVDYESMIDQTPGLAKWLEDPNNATLGRDDLDALGRINKHAQAMTKTRGGMAGDLVRAGETGFRGIESSAWHLAAAYGLSTPEEAAEQAAAANKRSQELRSMIPDYAKDFNEAMEREGGDVSKAFERFTGSFETLREGKIMQALKDFTMGQIQTVGEVTDMIGAAAVRPRGLLYSTTENLANSLPSLVAGGAMANGGAAVGALTGPAAPVAVPALAIGGMATGSFMGAVPVEVGAWINQELQSRGVDITDPQALTAAYKDSKLMADVRAEGERKGVTTAGVDALFNAFAGRFMKGAKPGLAAKAVAGTKEIATQTVGEITSEFSGQVAAKKGLEGTNFGEAIQEGITSLGRSVVDAAVGTSTRKLFSKSTAKAAEEVTESTQNALKSLHEIEQMQEIGKAVKELKNTGAVPGKVRELIDSGQAPEAVFFQTEDWDSYWRSKGKSPAKAAEEMMDDGGKAYFEAKMTGQDIQIPFSQYIEKTARAEDFEGLLPSVKTSADGMTAQQSIEHMKSLPATLQELAAETIPDEEQAGPTPEQSSAAVGKEIADQLKEVGVDPTQAILYQEGFRVLGERMGMDPKELFDQYRLKITGELPAGEGATYNQDAQQPPGTGVFRLRDADGEVFTETFKTREEAQAFIEQSGVDDDVKSGIQIFEEAPPKPRPPGVNQLGFYSQVEREIEKMDFKQIPAKDLASRIKNIQGIKKEELEWLGLEEWLKLMGEGGKKFTPVHENDKDGSGPGGKRPTFNTRAEAESYINGDGNDRQGWTIKEETTNASGKVTKEQVQEFIRNNGVKISQVTLAADYQREFSGERDEDSDLPHASDLSWGEETFQSARDVDYSGELRQNEAYERAREDVENYWDEEYIQDEAKDLKEDHTDEDGNVDEAAWKEAVLEKMSDKYYEQATEDIESGESIWSVGVIEESETGYSLQGGGERDWVLYDDRGREVVSLDTGRAEEAKVQAIQYLIREGVIQGSIADTIRAEDIKWNNPTAAIAPTQATVKKRAKKLITEERARLEAKVKEERYWVFDEVDGKIDYTTPDNIKALEKGVQEEAEDEARDYYNDPKNPKAKVTVGIRTSGVDAKLIGNDKSGYEFTYGDEEQREKISKPLEEAKAEAVRLLQEKGLIAKPKAPVDPNQPEPEVDLNKPVGRTNWNKFTVPGAENYREILLTLPQSQERFTYDTHFRGQENFVAHARISDRVDAKGRKTLFIEEIQSDWHQQGRERGYKDKEYEAKMAEANAKAKLASDKYNEAEKTSEAWNDLKKYIGSQYEDVLGTDSSWNATDLATFAVGGLNGPSVEHDRAKSRFGIELVDKMLADKALKELADSYSKINDAASKALTELQAAQEERRNIEGGVPDAPFKQTDAWAALVMKRMIRMAAEQGYDAVAWTPADVHTGRWGTDQIAWVKKEGTGFEIIGENGKIVRSFRPLDNMDTVEAELEKYKNVESSDEYLNLAKKYDDGAAKIGRDRHAGINSRIEKLLISEGLMSEQDLARFKDLTEVKFRTFGDPKNFKIQKPGPFWLVGAAEQRGGNADGMDIEATARARGEILERDGQRVTTKEDLRKIVEDVLSRERNDRSLNSLTDSLWKQMQEKETGEKKPRKEGFDFFYNKLIPDTVKKLVKKMDPDAKIEVGGVHTSESAARLIKENPADAEQYASNEDIMQVLELPITDKIKSEAELGFTLFQQDQGDIRGQIRIGPGGINISILKNANFSTFIHETGHFYLEVLKDLAARDTAPQQIKDDWQAIRNWLGAKDGEELTVDMHEKFAVGFEGYLLEGKAPTSKLAEAFARFKVWLMSVYRKLRPAVEFSPEIKDVMNRLFATDEELRIAQGDYPALFDDPAATGMNEKQAERYMQARFEAKLAAEEELTRKIMKDFRRQEQAFYKEKRKGVENEVREELINTREYAALAILQSKLPSPDVFKISSKSIQDMGLKVSELPPRVTAKDGLHVEQAALALGFRDGDELVSKMRGLPKLEDAIKAETDRRMQEYYPDILQDPKLSEETIKSIHNEKRSELLEIELAHLAMVNPSTLKDVTRRIVRRPPTIKEIRKEAVRVIGTMKAKDIKPHLFQLAERKAAKEAGKALTDGDLDASFEAKQRELLNHELYREAQKAREIIDDAIVDFRKFRQSDDKLAKSRDMNLVDTARGILAAFGIGQEGADLYVAQEILAKMQRYDQDNYETAKTLFEDATQNGVGPWKSVPFDDFVAMKQSVDALWDLAKNVKQIEIDGKKMDLEQIKEELIAQSSKFVDKKAKEKYTETAGPWAKAKSKLLSAKADLIRVEHWAEAMDTGGNREFTNYVFRPIADAATQYRLQKADVIRKYEAIIRAHEPNMSRDAIESDELGHRFKTKTELLMALLHSGNESNLRKLLVGRGWGTVDETGRLDTSRWDTFIKRMQDTGVLTKADYDFAQQIWDLMESLKPGAQKAHKQMYGYYFKEITADGVTTPFGDYRGGYIPAKIDVNESEDIDIRQEREAFEKNNNSWQFPTTGRGFTKSRVEQYAAPLTLDMNMLGGHIDSVLRFTNIEPRVKEVSRIVMDKGFREALRQVDPGVAKDALVPWLQRAAQQQVVIPSRDGLGRLTDAMASKIRSAVAMQIMFANVTNTLQQLTGVAVAAVKIKPKYLRNAIVRYITDAKGVSSEIQERSEWMRSIQGSTVYESAQAIQNIIVQPSTFENIQQFTQRHTYFLQTATQNLVNNVVWVAGYNQALEAGMTEAQAAKEADSKVRTTQGTVNPEDVSRFETGTQTERLFKQFVGYFNMLANLNGFEIQKIARETGLKKGAGRAFYVYSMGVMIPAVLSELIVRAMSGKGFDEDDDDQYLDDALAAFFGSQFKTIAATVPYGGQVAVSAYNRFNEQRYDDRLSLSPVISIIEGTAGVPYELYKNIAQDADNEKKLTKDVLTLVGVMSSLPAGPIGKPVGYLMDVGSGRAQPTGPVDFTRGLVTGKSGQRY